MMNKYMLAGFCALLSIFLIYFFRFFIYLDYELSKDQGVWGQFGDFIGGTLNPILSFVTVVLLVKSLKLQNDANRSLVEQINASKKFERFRIYENFFFNMLNNQKKAFELFSITDETTNSHPVKLTGAEAVSYIEVQIEILRAAKVPEQVVFLYVENQESGEMFFNAVRMFYVIVKNIDEQISDKYDFTDADREEQYQTLINFTDFSNLRLIILCMQFFDYPAVLYLKGHVGLNKVFDKLGVKRSPY